MRLRKPCPHGRYDHHFLEPRTMCPGGGFLPEGALVIERDEGGHWPMWAIERIYFEANEMAGFEVRILDALVQIAQENL